MEKLTLELFTSIIESIRLQIQKDIVYSQKIADVLSISDDGVGLYDNSLLIKSLVQMLQLHFPKKDSFCEIEHYMFELNFGKQGEEELITVEDLWHQLNKDNGLDRIISWKDAVGISSKTPLVSTHPLIDDAAHCARIFDFKDKTDNTIKHS